MAILTGGIAGGLKGKVGKLVTRKVNGKTVVSERPDHYKETKSEEAKLQRGRFTITVEFSRYINSIALLKDVWKYNFPKCSSAYNMMMRHNIKKVGDRAPSLINIITPQSVIRKNECPYFLRGISFNGEEITAAFENIEEVISLYGEADYYIMFVILYYEPKEKGRQYFVMDNIKYPLDLFTSGKNLQIKFTSFQQEKAALYKKAVIYSAVIVYESNKNKFYSSYTSAEEFVLT